MAQLKVTWYSVTIWDGSGSGEKLKYTTSIDEAMRWRKHNRTIDQTDYKVKDFYRSDIPCSQIDVYRLKDGENIKDKEPVLTLTWY